MKTHYQKLFLLPLFFEVCLSTFSGGLLSTSTCLKNNQDSSQCSINKNSHSDNKSNQVNNKNNITPIINNLNKPIIDYTITSHNGIKNDNHITNITIDSFQDFYKYNINYKTNHTTNYQVKHEKNTIISYYSHYINQQSLNTEFQSFNNFENVVLSSFFIFVCLSILLHSLLNKQTKNYFINKTFHTLLLRLLAETIILFLKKSSLFYCEFKNQFQFNQFYKHFTRLPTSF